MCHVTHIYKSTLSTLLGEIGFRRLDDNTWRKCVISAENDKIPFQLRRYEIGLAESALAKEDLLTHEL